MNGSRAVDFEDSKSPMPETSTPMPHDRPKRQLLEEIAADLDRVVSLEEIEHARQMLASYREGLLKLRSLDLEYFPECIEPAMAQVWIQRGGRSDD